MSQDTKSNTTSRRAFLLRSAPVAAAVVMAGSAIAVEAAAALPADPIPIAPAPAADPIFALIEQHRAALREEKRTHDLFKEHADDPQEDDNHRGVVVGEKPVRGFETVQRDADTLHVRFPLTSEMKPITVFNEKFLPDYVLVDLNEAERAAWIANKTNELRRNRRAYNRRYSRTARCRTFDAWNKATKVTDSLDKQIGETSPTTVAGIAAVLSYWSGIMNEDTCFRDIYHTQDFLKRLSGALQRGQA
jgi:hypothetical protein